MTFGVLVASSGAPEVAEFERRIDAVFEHATTMDGYIGRSRYVRPWLDGVADEDQDWGAWVPTAEPPSTARSPGRATIGRHPRCRCGGAWRAFAPSRTDACTAMPSGTGRTGSCPVSGLLTSRGGSPTTRSRAGHRLPIASSTCMPTGRPRSRSISAIRSTPPAIQPRRRRSAPWPRPGRRPSWCFGRRHDSRFRCLGACRRAAGIWIAANDAMAASVSRHMRAPGSG